MADKTIYKVYKQFIKVYYKNSKSLLVIQKGNVYNL